MISILYVDDEPDLLELAQIFLEQTGEFRVRTATSAEEVLADPGIFAFDAILSDYQMPGMDGIAFLKEIRKKAPDLPFILFTGRGREEIVIEALNNGADFYIQKGGDPKAQFAELANKIRYAVQKKTAERELVKKSDELRASCEQISANEEELRQQLDELSAQQVALRESEERFRAFTENVPDLTTISDVTGRYTYVSPSIQRITGRNAEAMLGKSYLDVDAVFGVLPEDTEILVQSGKAAIADPKKPSPIPPFRVRSADGAIVLLEGTVTFLPDIKGISGLLFHGRDITDRIRAEEALQEKNDELLRSYEQITASEEELKGQFEALVQSEARVRESETKFRGIFEKSYDAHLVFTDWRCVDCNQPAVRLFGYTTKEEMIGLHPKDLFPVTQPDGRDSGEAAAALIRNIVQRGSDHLEWVHKRKDGSTFPADTLISVFELDGQLTVLVSVRDISDRKRTEEELELLKISVDRSSDEVFWMDFSGSILYVNDAACQTTGYSREELCSMKLFELDPDFPPEVWDTSVADLRARKTQFIQTRHQRKDGTLIDVEIVAVYVSKGDREYSFAFVRDITGRKRTEQTLAESEERYRTLVDSSFDGIAIHQDGTLVFVNQTGVRMMGLSDPAELIGRPAIEIIHPDDRSLIAERIRISPEQSLELIHERFLRADGSIIHVDVATTPCMWQGRPATYVTFRDISIQKKAQEALRESEENYRSLIELAPIAIVVHRDGKNVYANPEALRMIKANGPEDIIGKEILAFVSPEYQERTLGAVRKMAKEGGMLPPQMQRVVAVDGEVLTVEIAAKPVNFQGLPSIMVLMRNITEQKKTEDALFDSRQMLQTVLDTIPQRVFWKDKNSVFLGCNKANARDAGFADPAEMVGKTDYDYTSTKVAERYRADDRQVMETGQERVNYEEPQVRPDGTNAWLRTSKVPLRDKEGTVVGVLGTYEDVTGYKQSQEALIESEEKYRTLVENASEVIAIVQDWKIVFVNQQGARLLGTTPDKLTGRLFMDFIWPDDRGRLNEIHGKRMTGETAPEIYDFRVIGAGERPVWVSNSIAAIPWEGRPATLSLMTNITERKSAEAALQESEDTFRSVIEGAPEAIYIGADWNFQYLNPAALRLFGASSGEQLIGTPFMDRIHPKFHDAIRKRVVGLYDERVAAPSLEEVYVKLDGSEMEVEVSSVPFRFKGKDGALVFIHDITDRKKAERARRESEAEYRRILDTMQDAYVRTDAEGKIVRVNPSAARMFGYVSFQEMHGIPVSALYSDPARRQEILTRLEKENVVTDVVEMMLRMDTTTFWASINVQAMRGEDGRLTGTEGILRDVTERRAMEQAIGDTNKKLSLLNSITRHDVANQLTAIRGYAQLAELSNPDPVVLDFLQKIETASDTIAGQIEFTKAYQELGEKTPAWFRIEEIIERTARSGVSFSNTCRAIEIFADPMIERVFYNLFDNAIRHGDHVTAIGVRCERAPDGLVIYVEDDGVGVVPEEKEKIFEKGFGKNTGFGLFLAKEILATTGITIRETGYVGVGARFEITVPKEMWRVFSGG